MRTHVSTIKRNKKSICKIMPLIRITFNSIEMYVCKDYYSIKVNLEHVHVIRC